MTTSKCASLRKQQYFFLQEFQLNCSTKSIITINVSCDVLRVFHRVFTNFYTLGSDWHACSVKSFRTNRRLEVFPAVNQCVNQTKPRFLAVQLWRWQPQSLLYLLLSRNMGLKNNQGLNACQFPWRTVAVYSSPARLFDLHALSFGRCGSLVRAFFQIHRHQIRIAFLGCLASNKS